MKRLVLLLILLLTSHVSPLTGFAAQSPDYTLDNQPGAQFRAEINAILAAAQTQNSGAAAPSNPTAYMVWADTTSGYLKIRNAANTAWIAGPRLADMQAPDSAKLDGAAASSYQTVANMTTTATAGKGVLRDGSGRAKIADGAAIDDIMAIGQYTAASVLSKLLTVDGAGSGVDADKVDGYEASASATASTVPVRDSNGKLAGDILGNAATVAGYSVSAAATASTVPVRDANGKLAGDILGNAATADAASTVTGSSPWPALTAGTTYVLAEALPGHLVMLPDESNGWTLSFSFDRWIYSATAYTKVAEVVVPASGAVSTSFWLENYGGSNCGRVYLNGAAVGTAHCLPPAGKATDASIAVVVGDKVQLYLKTSSGVTMKYGYFRVMTDTRLPVAMTATDEHVYPR